MTSRDIWKKFLETDSLFRVRKNRVYIVDYPAGLFHSCFSIIQTCETFHMFGAGSETPTYEGAETLRVVSDKATRRKEILEFTIQLLCELSPAKRLSVYTTDSELESLLDSSIDLAARNRLSFFGVFRIRNMEHVRMREWSERQSRYYVTCPLCGVSVWENRLERHFSERCHKRKKQKELPDMPDGRDG